MTGSAGMAVERNQITNGIISMKTATGLPAGGKSTITGMILARTVYCRPDAGSMSIMWEPMAGCLRTTGWQILVDSEGKKDTSIKKEKELPLESLTLNKESITLLQGETANLLTQWQPQDTTRWKYMQWTSSDPGVAEVSRGKNNGCGEGTATITASMGTKEATCTVTVTDSAVCKTALTLQDAQYIWGGNGPQDGGVDCSGLLMYAYTQNGYDFGADLNANNFARYGQEISREELQPGDAICTCYNGERYQHILLYIGNDMVVASECGGPTVCSLGLNCEQHVKAQNVTAVPGNAR